MFEYRGGGKYPLVLISCTETAPFAEKSKILLQVVRLVVDIPQKILGIKRAIVTSWETDKLFGKK